MKKHLISWLLGIGLCFAFVLGVALAVPASRAPLLGWFRGEYDQAPQGERDQAPKGEHLHQGKTLEEWVRRLQSDDLDSRHSACFAFQYFKSEDAVRAVPILVPLLQSKEDRLRAGAAYALGRIGPLARDGLLPLTALLTDEKAQVRTATAEALDLMCTPEAGGSIPALSTALKNAVKEEPTDEAGGNYRFHIAGALGKIGPEAKTAVAPLTDLLTAKDALLRSAAGEALGKIGADAKAAVPALTAALEDSDSQVRLHAAQALWRIERQEKAVPVLLEVFKNAKHADLRRQAARALGTIGPAAKSAVPVLLDAARNDPTRGAAGRYDIRIAATQALKQIDPEAAARVNDR